MGRDAVMRAVASAVLQADALEHALLAALPLGPQGAAGGVSLPDLFQGELQVGRLSCLQGPLSCRAPLPAIRNAALHAAQPLAAPPGLSHAQPAAAAAALDSERGAC